MLPESRIFDYEISAGAGGASNGLHGCNRPCETAR